MLTRVTRPRGTQSLSQSSKSLLLLIKRFILIFLFSAIKTDRGTDSVRLCEDDQKREGENMHA